jgi:hypothetical protein
VLIEIGKGTPSPADNPELLTREISTFRGLEFGTWVGSEGVRASRAVRRDEMAELSTRADRGRMQAGGLTSTSSELLSAGFVSAGAVGSVETKNKSAFHQMSSLAMPIQIICYIGVH